MALGAAAGIAVSLVANLGLWLVTDPPPPLPAILIHLSATVFAGFVAGRLAHAGPAMDGGMAGLLIFFFAGVVSILGGAAVTMLELVMLGVVAAVLGSAGGVLADRRATG